MTRHRSWLLIVACLLAWSAGSNAAWYEDSQFIMGSHVHAELWADDTQFAERLLADVMAEIRRIDVAYSRFAQIVSCAD
jgi:hypothetical protein